MNQGGWTIRAPHEAGSQDKHADLLCIAYGYPEFPEKDILKTNQQTILATAIT